MTGNDYSGHTPASAEDGGMGALKPVLIGLTILGVIGAAAFVAFMVAVEKGVFPDGRVMRGSELPERIASQLREHVLEPDETVLLFASLGPLSIWDDGQLLTDKRVVSWVTDVRETSPDEMALVEVDQVSAHFSTGLVGFTGVSLFGPDDENGDYESVDFAIYNVSFGDVYFVKGIVTEALREGAPLTAVYINGDISDEHFAEIPQAERYEPESEGD